MEPVVGGELVNVVVTQNIVPINLPSASDPHVNMLIEDTLLGKLVVNVMLSWQLELCVQLLALNVLMVFLVMVVVAVAS